MLLVLHITETVDLIVIIDIIIPIGAFICGPGVKREAEVDLLLAEAGFQHFLHAKRADADGGMLADPVKQIVIHTHVFFPKITQKAVGLALPVTMIALLLIFSPQVAFEAHDFLPDEPFFSAEAMLSVEDDSIAEVAFEQPEEGRILIEAHKYGETGITVTDGEKIYRYTIVIYDDKGVDRAKIEPVGQP